MRTDVAAPAQSTIVARVLVRARRCPDTVAVRDSEGEMTYGELIAAVGVVAARLAGRGIGADDLVAVTVSRSRYTLVALLGVLGAGAAYVPLEPSLPAARLSDIVAASRPALLLVPDVDDAGPPLADVERVELGALLAGARSAATVTDRSVADALAYVIFTSGSTGAPKGVCIPHSAVLNLLDHMCDQPGLREGQVMLGVTTPAFDLSVPDLFLPLVTGATLVLAARRDCTDGQALRALVEREAPDLMQATPSTWRLLLAAGWPGVPRMRVVCGGEAYEAALARSLVARCAEVWNFYGPTETTVWSVAQRLDAEVTDPIPIGQPIRGTTVAVLGADGAAVAVGETGELVIGGAGVARGYLGRPELSAAAFVAGYDGASMFRTGDFVRRDAEGRMTFVERRDSQVKVRGYRVELGDVETALRGCPGVAQAVAVAVGAPSTRIVGFVVARGEWADAPGGGSPATGAVSSELVIDAVRARLPAYMVPTHVHVLSAFPMTANGKVDRGALAASTDAGPPARGPRVPTERSGTPIEARVTEIWRDVLGVEPEASDDFFDLGGDSLAATRIVARAAFAFGVSVDVATIFEHPTVGDFALSILAALLDDLAGGDVDGALRDVDDVALPAASIPAEGRA